MRLNWPFLQCRTIMNTSNGIRTITGEEQDPRGLNIILFSYFWLCWVFVAARELSLVVVSGGYSLVAVHEFLIEVCFTYCCTPEQ